jgi:hypothetical protein
MSEPKTRKSPFGLTAVIPAGAALFGAVMHFWAGPFAEPPPIEETLAEAAVSIRDAVTAELSGEEPEESSAFSGDWDVDRIIQVSVAGIALLGVFLAVASFLRRDDIRHSGADVAPGGRAIAFQVFAIALGIIVAAIVIGFIIHSLGFS